MNRYRVVIIEPATLIAEGLQAILAAYPDVERVSCIEPNADIAHPLRITEPDVVLINMSVAHLMDSCEELESIPTIGIQSAIVAPATQNRFAHTITTFSSAEAVKSAIREVVATPSERSYAESHELSERERDVLVLVARGYTNKEIASELNISPHTVISHRKNIVHKTGIRSVAGLTVYAVLNKLIDSEQL